MPPQIVSAYTVLRRAGLNIGFAEIRTPAEVINNMPPPLLLSAVHCLSASGTGIKHQQTLSVGCHRPGTWYGATEMNETIAYFQAMIVVGHEIAKLDIGLAGANAIQGDKDAAYRWLERAVDGGFLRYRYLLLHPCFSNLHGEVKFRQLITQVKTKADQFLAPSNPIIGYSEGLRGCANKKGHTLRLINLDPRCHPHPLGDVA